MVNFDELFKKLEEVKQVRRQLVMELERAQQVVCLALSRYKGGEHSVNAQMD